jgi:hypothetical protein
MMERKINFDQLFKEYHLQWGIHGAYDLRYIIGCNKVDASFKPKEEGVGILNYSHIKNQDRSTYIQELSATLTCNGNLEYSNSNIS